MPKEDPLSLGELDPSAVSAAIEAKSKAKIKPPSELDLKKEDRLFKKEERLASAKGSSAPGPSVPPVPQVDVSALLDRVAAYKERFPHLKSRNKVTAKSSPEEIEDELHYLELQLGASKDGSMGTMLFTGAMSGLEAFTRDVYNPFGLKLNGLGQVAKDNVAQFQDTIDELMIKYGAGMYMSPETRLVVSVGMLVVTVHSANSGDARIGETLRKMNAAANPPAGSADL